MGIPILGDIFDAVKDLASELIVDKDKKNEILYKIEELRDKSDERLHQELLGQIEINKVEAAHPSIFVAGWRPFVGWVCGIGLSWAVVLSPFVESIARFCGWAGTMPTLQVEVLMTLLLSMLGIGAQRSFEKAKGVETTRVSK